MASKMTRFWKKLEAKHRKASRIRRGYGTKRVSEMMIRGRLNSWPGFIRYLMKEQAQYKLCMYADQFYLHGVDWMMLAELDSGDLSHIGVAPEHHQDVYSMAYDLAEQYTGLIEDRLYIMPNIKAKLDEARRRHATISPIGWSHRHDPLEVSMPRRTIRMHRLQMSDVLAVWIKKWDLKSARNIMQSLMLMVYDQMDRGGDWAWNARGRQGAHRLQIPDVLARWIEEWDPERAWNFMQSLMPMIDDHVDRKGNMIWRAWTAFKTHRLQMTYLLAIWIKHWDPERARTIMQELVMLNADQLDRRWGMLGLVDRFHINGHDQPHPANLQTMTATVTLSPTLSTPDQPHPANRQNMTSAISLKPPHSHSPQFTTSRSLTTTPTLARDRERS